MAAYDVAYQYSGEQYINYGHRVILMKIYKALMEMDLMYVPIW